MTFAVYNPGGLGDCFLSLDLCNLIKNRLPDEEIVFLVSKNAHNIIGDVLKLQTNIDYLGFIESNNFYITYCKNKNINSLKEIKRIYDHSNSYTDISPRQSFIAEFIKEYGLPKNHNSIVTYNLDVAKHLPETLTIAVNDLSDWVVKRPYDLSLKTKVESLLKDKYKAEVIEIGQDSGLSYLENLRKLNNCHLYLGFFGSLSTFAAGIAVDTITYPTVMPPAWIHSSFYSSGWHKQILPRPENHCKGYKCIEPRSYYYGRTEPTNIKGKDFLNFLGPPIIKNHNNIWAETCDYTVDKKSCISKMSLEDIDNEISMWLEHRNKTLLT